MRLAKRRFARRAAQALLLPAVAWLAVGCGPAPTVEPESAPAETAGGAVASATAEDASGSPRVVAVDPPNGAQDVDPRRTVLMVTFDRGMDREGWSWVTEDPATAPDLLDQPWFDESGRVHTSRVRLDPGRTYVVWLNSDQFQYFRDLTGRAAVPYRWTFTTRGSDAAPVADAAAIEPFSAHRLPPRIVELDPPAGARDIDPATDHLRVVFDRPMRDSWSWVTEDPTTFPETRGRPFFEADRRSHSLPVRLEPGRTYVIWLNSSQYRLFRSVDGEELPPQRWTFTTAPAR